MTKVFTKRSEFGRSSRTILGPSLFDGPGSHDVRFAFVRTQRPRPFLERVDCSRTFPRRLLNGPKLSGPCIGVLRVEEDFNSVRASVANK